MWLRAVTFVGSVLIFIAISKIEQATVTAMIFLYPLLVGLLGALFLGEHIGPRRVIFIVLGFVGVALAAGVTPSTFEFWAILPALGAVLISDSGHFRAMGCRSHEQFRAVVHYGDQHGAVWDAIFAYGQHQRVGMDPNWSVCLGWCAGHVWICLLVFCFQACAHGFGR